MVKAASITMSQWPFYDTDTYTRVYTLHGTLGYHCKCESMVALIVKPAKSKEEDKGKDKEKDKQKYEHWCELLIIKPRWQSSVAVAVRILLPPSCSCNQSLLLTSAGVVRFLICSVLFSVFLMDLYFCFCFYHCCRSQDPPFTPCTYNKPSNWPVFDS